MSFLPPHRPPFTGPRRFPVMAHSHLNIDLLLYAALLLVVSGMALLKPRSDFDEGVLFGTRVSESRPPV
jgi:hypothetical protein